MPTSKHRRKGKTRPRGKPPRMPPWPVMPPEEDAVEDAPPPSAADLPDWHPHIRRELDPRQPSLPLEPNDGRPNPDP
jgi:hypothetical protein